MARLHADENFPLPVTEALRRRGHDVLTARDAGRAGQGIPDEDVLAFAEADSRIVLTIDRRDFIRLDRAGVPHVGIVACTLDHDFEGQAGRIHKALASFRDEPGRVVIRVNRP